MKEQAESNPNTTRREERLKAIRRAVNHPDNLDDITIDMIFSILCHS